MASHYTESAFTITITAEVALGDLIEDGPEAFAKRVREMLDAELEPLLGLDWKKLRPPVQAARAQEVGGHSPSFVDRSVMRDVKAILDSRNRTKT